MGVVSTPTFNCFFTCLSATFSWFNRSISDSTLINSVESHLKGGRQDIPTNLCDMEYGQSVTDGCIDWETTEKVLLDMHEALKDTLANR